MTEGNGWDQIADTDTVDGPIERLMREEMMEAFKHLKIGRLLGNPKLMQE